MPRSGSALAGVAALPSTSAAQSSAPRGKGPTHPADAWLDDLTGQHKNIYDCTTVENGPTGWTFARNFLTANTGPIYQLKDADINVIVCVRHLATAFGFNDAMWAKYKLGESQKVNEGGVPAVRNPHANTADRSRQARRDRRGLRHGDVTHRAHGRGRRRPERGGRRGRLERIS